MIKENQETIGSRVLLRHSSCESVDFGQHYRAIYSGYDGDDEVFIDIDETTSTYKVRMSDGNSQPRQRKTSDVIDSLGEESPVRLRQPTSPDIRMSTSSLPSTPRSDFGYCSSGGSSSVISPSLEPRPRWFRFSGSELSTLSTRQTSSTSEDAPTLGQNSPPSKNEIINDAVDAMPFPPQDSTPSVSSYSNNVINAVAPVDRESHIYNMNHKYRGIGLIFNHEQFTSCPARTGSKIDVLRLTELYNILGLQIRAYDDLPYKEIMSIINKVSAEDHSENDCLFVTVLTHGLQANYLYSYDIPYKVSDLWGSFTGDRCTSLAGKPKIFIIQACRGDELDSGVHLVTSRTETDAGSQSYMIPRMADFYLAYSTFEGYYSWRNPENGTWFIQSLFEVFAAEHMNLDLVTMMTRVSYKVAIEHESCNDQILDMHRKKQVPSTTSTLLRQVFFTPKK